MSTDYNYDEQGQFFPYFVTTITALITIPVTYSLLKPSKEPEDTAPRIKSGFKTDHGDLIEAARRKRRRRERKIKRTFVSAVGWAVIAWMVYLMLVTARSTPKLWDPYDILGISRSASEKEIKSHYRRLSITQHPDKARPDPAKNETEDTINEHWVEITKAFKALTDEEVRNNFIKYGNPDGKQSFSVGIALPQFIVTEGNGKYVLLLYGLFLGVVLPYIVGRWWYGSQSVTKEGVLTSTAGKLFKEYDDQISAGGVVNALSAGDEYQDTLKGPRAEAGLSRVEKVALTEGDGTLLASAELNYKDMQRLAKIDDSTRRKALGLLWAYLGRLELQDQILLAERYELAPTALKLVDSFIVMCLAYGWTKPLLSSLQAHQYLVQAVAPGASPLLQLPYFTQQTVEAIEGKGHTHASIQTFMSIPDDERRQKLVTSGLLDDAQYKAALSVARQMPVFKVEKTFFKVVGERFIVPNSLVQFVVKGRFVPLGSRAPLVNELDLEDVDPEEGDMDALRGKKKAIKTVEGEVKEALEEKPAQPALAHAPFLAKDQNPRWHLFLADPRQLKVAVPPFTFTNFENPIFNEAGEPTFNMQTLKMQFVTPPQPGEYTFIMHLICDAYVGFDTTFNVYLTVDDPAKAEALQEDDEISEPDEDTFTGQMNALKTGQLTGAPPKKKKEKVAEADEDDDDSDTDGDDDTESETDTETDTDGE